MRPVLYYVFMKRFIIGLLAAIGLVAATGCNELQVMSVERFSTGTKVSATEVGPGSSGMNSFHAIAECVTPPGAHYIRIGNEASTVDGNGNQGNGWYASWAWCEPGDINVRAGYAGRYR